MTPLRLRVLAVAFLGSSLAAVAVVLATDPRVRSAVKARGESLDVSLTGGVVRRVAYGPIRTPALSELPVLATGAYAWIGTGRFLPVAHALGLDVGDGPNTVTSLEASRDLGFRVFEVDLVPTRDGRVVCYHGSEGEDLRRLDWGSYLRIMQDAGRTPCEFRDIVAAARRHPDITIILDVKLDFSRAYGLIRKELDSSTGKSFVPQIYDFQQIREVREGSLFAGEIFTSYRSGLQTPEILRLAHKGGVRVVTLTLPRFREVAGRIPPGLTVLTHPVDDATLAWWLRSQGAGGIYTSVLSPQEIPSLYSECTKRLKGETITQPRC